MVDEDSNRRVTTAGINAPTEAKHVAAGNDVDPASAQSAQDDRSVAVGVIRKHRRVRRARVADEKVRQQERPRHRVPRERRPVVAAGVDGVGNVADTRDASESAGKLARPAREMGEVACEAWLEGLPESRQHPICFYVDGESAGHDLAGVVSLTGKSGERPDQAGVTLRNLPRHCVGSDLAASQASVGQRVQHARW